MSEPKWPRKILIIRHGESEQNIAEDLLQDDLKNVLAILRKSRRRAIKRSI